eukprot:1158680-Pelagomonas_calceolata.AAC.5
MHWLDNAPAPNHGAYLKHCYKESCSPFLRGISTNKHADTKLLHLPSRHPCIPSGHKCLDRTINTSGQFCKFSNNGPTEHVEPLAC